MVRLLSVLFVLALSSSASAQMLDAYPEISAIEREAAAQIAVVRIDGAFVVAAAKEGADFGTAHLSSG